MSELVGAAPPALVEFVNDVLLPRLTGLGGDRRSRWCRKWFEHPDAVHRLLGVYEAYLEVVEGEMSWHVFYRDVLDHHIPILTEGVVGVFEPCAEGHEPHTQLDHFSA